MAQRKHHKLLVSRRDNNSSILEYYRVEFSFHIQQLDFPCCCFFPFIGIVFHRFVEIIHMCALCVCICMTRDLCEVTIIIGIQHMCNGEGAICPLKRINSKQQFFVAFYIFFISHLCEFICILNVFFAVAAKTFNVYALDNNNEDGYGIIVVHGKILINQSTMIFDSNDGNWD